MVQKIPSIPSIWNTYLLRFQDLLSESESMLEIPKISNSAFPWMGECLVFKMRPFVCMANQNDRQARLVKHNNKKEH